MRKKSGGPQSSRPRLGREPKQNGAARPKPAIRVAQENAGRRKSKSAGKSTERNPATISRIIERHPSRPFPIVGIGASAGGLEAFGSFLKALSAETGMAFVLVQHMDPAHESMLNRLLERDTAMPVFQVQDGMAVEPNYVYVIPPNTKMTIQAGRLRLVARPTGELRYSPIDSFLHSLAADQQGLAIGVILSGIGSDGTKGLQAIKSEGGITFAQDEHSAKYPGMPLSAVAAECVDLVLPPEKIARELARIGRYPYLDIARQPPIEEAPSGEDGNLLKIFRLLRTATGVDFTYYKQATIQRRISRRMVVRQCENLAQYLKFVQEHPDEVKALFQDVLIHVTAFFREPEVHQTLQKFILPRIAARLGEPLRIWVPGCSTGEEVYSLAISLHELWGETASHPAIQIFGTDISEADIQKARAAIYAEASTASLSAERLRRFFVKREGGHQVVKPIREMCVFARHDLTRDPPFSRMDLISCRNVLIYLAPAMQKKVLGFFHYALKPAGFLILGKSEGVSAAANLFSPANRKANVYSRKPAAPNPLPDFGLTEYGRSHAALPLRSQPAPPFDLRKQAERIVLERYAPPGFIVDGDLHILHFQGDTGPFLGPAQGEASFELLKLVRPELILETRAAIQEAKKLGIPAHREGIPFTRNGQTYRLDVEAVPVPGRSRKSVDFLVLFQNQRPEISEKIRPASQRSFEKTLKDSEAERLKRQLASAQEQLRSLVGDHEAAAEELRAANEEVLSSNEELQSTNEELQTAKEELQSSNEELTTLNEELHQRNVELAQTAADLNSLLDVIEMPILILGNDRRIRRFTPVGKQLLNLVSADIGRPISEIRVNLHIPDLDRMAREVVEHRIAVEREVRDQKGHWYALRMRPYQSAASRVEGILVVLVDIHDVKQYSTAIVETMRGSLLVLDSHLSVLLASQGFYKTFHVKREETESKLLWKLGDNQWDIPRLRELLEKVLPEKKEVVNYEVEHEFPAIGIKTMLLNARQLTDGGSPKILLVIEDITERKAAQERIRLLLARQMVGAEEEEKRIARELHDSFGPRLAGLNLMLGNVASRLSAQPDLARELREVSHEISEATKSAHDLSHALHPAALMQLGLASALEAECATFSRLSGINVNFTEENEPVSLPEEVALCFYRVAQASLENVRKHAHVKTASVRLARRGQETVMEIRDSGRGFNVNSAHKGGGLGLVSMEERVRLINGRLSVNSKPGEGTQVEVRVASEKISPLEPARASGGLKISRKVSDENFQNFQKFEL